MNTDNNLETKKRMEDYVLKKCLEACSKMLDIILELPKDEQHQCMLVFKENLINDIKELNKNAKT